jgi:hypothetical protein
MIARLMLILCFQHPQPCVLGLDSNGRLSMRKKATQNHRCTTIFVLEAEHLNLSKTACTYGIKPEDNV